MKPMCFQGEEILSEPLNVPRALWLAAVVTEDEKRWESHSKENLLPRMARHAFTMCQCSQPSCSASLSLCGIVSPQRDEGTAFNFNFCACHMGCYWCFILVFHSMMNCCVKAQKKEKRKHSSVHQRQCVIHFLIAGSQHKKNKQTNQGKWRPWRSNVQLHRKFSAGVFLWSRCWFPPFQWAP